MSDDAFNRRTRSYENDIMNAQEMMRASFNST